MAQRLASGRNQQRRSAGVSCLRTAGERVLQQVASGSEPSLAPQELSAAVRQANGLLGLPQDLEVSHLPADHSYFVWKNDSQLAANIALFSLSLRQSSPFSDGDGPGPSFASIRQDMCGYLSQIPNGQLSTNAVASCSLALALLRTHALSCYSCLFARAAEALQPAAASSVHAEVWVPAAVGGVLQSRAQSSTAMMSTQPGQAPAGRLPPSGQLRGGEQRAPSLQALRLLLFELLHVLGTLHVCKSGLAPNDASAATAGTSSGGGSSPGGSNGHNSKSNSSSSGSGEGSSGAASPLLPADAPKQTLQAHVHSSWALEHWARLLLLGTAAATASSQANGDSRGDVQRQAQALHAELLRLLCDMHDCLGLHFADFLRRPWGCALACTHMAQLCAALDGGGAFGMPAPDPLLLPHGRPGPEELVVRADSAARAHDAAAVGQLAGLTAALAVVEAWIAILAEDSSSDPATAAADGGEQQAEGGEGQDGAPAASPTHGDQAAGAGCARQDATWEQHAPGHSSLCRLPPLNRAATAALCLRLARGLVGSWGAPLPRVRLVSTDGTVRSEAPLLPKVVSCGLLHQVLRCARLALLPEVWGKVRVRGRVRAQLRAWWEAFVEAAEHREALLVTAVGDAMYPEWTYTEPTSLPAVQHGPSADAAAAIEAGLLPCMARLVTRMGAGGSGGGAVWCHPDRFPGFLFCLEQVLVFAPLGQVGELLSALGRRVRLAVEELRRVARRTAAAATAAGSGSGRVEAEARGGRTVGWLATVAYYVMNMAHTCVWVKGYQELKSADSEGTGSGGAGGRGAGNGGASGSEGGGGGAAGARHSSAAEAGAAAGLLDVRLSCALSELLPALVHGVYVCAELRRGPGWDALCERAGPEGGAMLHSLAEFGDTCAHHVLELVVMALARYGLERGAEGAAGGPGDGGGGSEATATGGSWPWRQMLLHDMRLMELLAVLMAPLRLPREGVAEHSRAGEGPLQHSPAGESMTNNLAVEVGYRSTAGDGGAGQYGAGGSGEVDDTEAGWHGAVPMHDGVVGSLTFVLPLAAVAFPAEFRVLVGGPVAAGEPGSSSELGSHACAAAAAADGGSGAAAAAESAGRQGVSPGVRRLAMEQLVRRLCSDQAWDMVESVLGGWDPGPDFVAAVAEQVFGEFFEETLEEARTVLLGLRPPAEARAAMAGAMAAAAAAAI